MSLPRTRGRARPAAAGTFYPAEPVALRAWITAALERARRDRPVPDHPPQVIVVPHAGYVYSGEVAAAAYASIEGAAGRIERVVVFGPAHWMPLPVIAAPSTAALATPLGPVPVDTARRETLERAGLITVDDAPHAGEHSLEVQLPFLQVALGEVAVLPLTAGTVGAAAVVKVLEAVDDDPATLVVVSTDLSHHHDYATASELDRRTAAAVVDRRADRLGPHSACGIHALRGLLVFAAGRSLEVEVLDLRNSGDTAGPRDRVVGYGAFACR